MKHAFRSPLLVAVIASTVIAIGGSAGSAQHDPNARNTRPAPYTPVNGKGGEDLSGPYQVVEGWPQPLPGHEGWHMGRAAAVRVETPDRIWIATSGELPANYQGARGWGPTVIPKMVPAIGELTERLGRYEHIVLIVDRNGKLIESWEQWNSTIKGVNRLLFTPYDPDHVFIVDQGARTVHKFTKDGKKLVFTLRTEDLIDGAQDIGWMPNGDFYVHGSSHVSKFSRDGKKLSRFGKPGSGPGEYQGMHGIVVDHERNRIYLNDRGNSRIQVVDLAGKPLDVWPNMIAPYAIRMTKDGQHLWITDGYTQKFLKFDLNGRMLTSWGTFGSVPGALWGPHDFETDAEGNLYVAEDYNARVQKFRPRDDGNRDQLVGELRR